MTMRGLLLWGGLLVGLLWWRNAVGGTMTENQRTEKPQEPRSSGGPTSGMGDDPIFSHARLTPAQRRLADLIVEASRAAGVNPAFMLALAVTESSLRSAVVGDDGVSVGLFQINVRAHPEYQGFDLSDPAVNIAIAIAELKAMHRQYPGQIWISYAEAWTLGARGRFKLGRRNQRKVTAFVQAIVDLNLDLNPSEVWP